MHREETSARGKTCRQEAMSATVPLGCEEMLTELEAIAGRRSLAGRRRGRSLKSCRMAAQSARSGLEQVDPISAAPSGNTLPPRHAGRY